MRLTKNETESFKAILREEMLTALGCTEPIAIAYAAAKSREILGDLPEIITVQCSGNIIKNAKAVTVPMTEDLKGIEAAAVLGAVGGDVSRELEVLSGVTPDSLELAKALLKKKICKVEYLDTKAKLHIIVKCEKGQDFATVEVVHTHLGVVKIERNGVKLLDIPYDPGEIEQSGIDKNCLSIEKIYAFARQRDFAGITGLLEHAINCNMQISQEGLNHPWGAQVGRTLLELREPDVRTRAIAGAAAGSDARMNGCEMGVVINSGSGNQGITITVPIVTYGKEMNADKEDIYAALALANLIAIHLKAKMGRLSAFCGAVSAGCAAACGIAFLEGADLEVINQTIINTLGNVGGVVCDGAKSSCAAKIAASVEAGILGYEMAKKGRGFHEGEGLVKKSTEETIDSFCRMARIGMQSTDQEILKIMVGA